MADNDTVNVRIPRAAWQIVCARAATSQRPRGVEADRLIRAGDQALINDDPADD